MYVGGGTPSLLDAGNLRKLVNGLRRHFDLSGLVEASIEVNPESATVELLEAALEAGINRVSVGVQSLSDSDLERVGRVHRAAQAIEAIRQARAAGFRSISADLIIGLPGQDEKIFRHSLETLTGLGIEHLSLYCLSIEDGTPLAANLPADLPSDDMKAGSYEQACDFLEKRGFVHYEISNFAIAGQECKHNLNYWRGGEYLGLGPAAASHLNGKRFNNKPDLHAYLENSTNQVEGVEELGMQEKAAEEAMLRLRLLAEGLNTDEMGRRFGRESISGLIARLDSMSDSGAIIRSGAKYRIAPSRILTSNPIFAGVL